MLIPLFRVTLGRHVPTSPETLPAEYFRLSPLETAMRLHPCRPLL